LVGGWPAFAEATAGKTVGGWEIKVFSFYNIFFSVL